MRPGLMSGSLSKPQWSLSSPPALRRSKATPHGTIPRSQWITTRQSLLYAGTPMKTSTSTMRTAWTAPWPTQGAPWMAVLTPRCSGSPDRHHQHLLRSFPHPRCSLSAVTLATHPHSPQNTQQNPLAGRPQLLLRDRNWIVCWEAVEWPVRVVVLGERQPS